MDESFTLFWLCKVHVGIQYAFFGQFFVLWLSAIYYLRSCTDHADIITTLNSTFNHISSYFHLKGGGVAQLVEHLSCKQGFEGSNPELGSLIPP